MIRQDRGAAGAKIEVVLVLDIIIQVGCPSLHVTQPTVSKHEILTLAFLRPSRSFNSDNVKSSLIILRFVAMAVTRVSIGPDGK